MRFSIIVPIYNVKKFIKRGMECLDRQSFRDFEVIMVDDGSTDGSSELLDEIEKSYANVRVFHQANAGSGPARNLGIKNARGEYIAFFDIDDILRPDAMYNMAAILADADPEIAVFSYSEVCPSVNTNNDFVFPDLYLNSNDEIREIYIPYLSGIQFNNGFVWNKAYRRDFIANYNLRFRQLRIQQDEVFNLEAYHHVNSMIISSMIIYDYYIYPKGNASSSVVVTRPEVAITVRNAFLALIEKWNLYNEQLIINVHRRFVYQYLIMSLEREVPDKKLNPGRQHRLQYIQRLLESQTFRQSIEYLFSVGFRADTFYKRLYLNLAHSNSISTIDLARKVESNWCTIRHFIRECVKFRKHLRRKVSGRDKRNK